MTTTLAFDVYGTLIDTTGVVTALSKHLGDRAGAFSQLWRDKQLEYSFRRGLMRKYQNFAVCTSNALDYACRHFEVNLSESEKKLLMSAYRVLPSFPDVEPSLSKLKTASYRIFAFSNGRADDVRALLQNAKIENYFQDVVSVDEIGTFKPDPAVYKHFLARSEASGEKTWLISGNPFDVIGALSAGMNVAWLRRSPQAIFDPWGFEPTIEISSLSDLHSALQGHGK
jgi:2-haloacid dehalogenase